MKELLTKYLAINAWIYKILFISELIYRSQWVYGDLPLLDALIYEIFVSCVLSLFVLFLYVILFSLIFVHNSTISVFFREFRII